MESPLRKMDAYPSTEKRPALKWRLAIMIVLSLILFQATLTLSFAAEAVPTEPASVERAIEQLMESKVRSALKPLLDPQEYAVVVNATLKKDLQAWNTFRASQVNPRNPDDSVLGLKDTASIQITLAQEVAKDRENLIRKEVLSALRLDEKTGDRLTMNRAETINSAENPGNSTESMQWSLKTWATLILMVTGGLSGLLLWGQSRKKASPLGVATSPLAEEVLCPIEEVSSPTVETSTQPEEISVFNETSSLAAEFLSKLPASREEEVLDFLSKHHPEEFQKIRRVRVVFSDIPSYPRDVLEGAFAGVDSLVLQKMISGEFGSEAEAPSSAENRRHFCALVEHQLELRNFDRNLFWDTRS